MVLCRDGVLRPMLALLSMPALGGTVWVSYLVRCLLGGKSTQTVSERGSVPLRPSTQRKHTMADFNRADLEFILQQIQIAEANAAGTDLRTLLPNDEVPYGLRTVDGTLNNLVPT